MKNDRLPWLILVICLLLMIAAIIWISTIISNFESDEFNLAEQRSKEENARICLYHLDAAAQNIINREFNSINDINEKNIPRTRNQLVKGYIFLNKQHSYITHINFPDAHKRLIQGYKDSSPKFIAAREEEPEISYRNKLSWNARANLYDTEQRAFFIEEECIVLRKDKDDIYRGIFLDLKQIKPLLIDNTNALFTDLILRNSIKTDSFDRKMTVLPLTIDFSQTTFYYEPPHNRKSFMLLIAWSCVLLPAVGLAVLLLSAITLNNRRAAFVAAVTHELRTPLTTFRMYTDMLNDGMVPEEKRAQYYKTLQLEADRLGHLVENVLNYARIDQHRKETELTIIPASELIQRIEHELTLRSQRENMTLNINDQSQGTKIKIDIAAMERVLINLIDNACKYGSGNDNRNIDLTVSKAAGNIQFSVRDYGLGIPEDVSKKLFKPFSKSDKEAANSASGIGLGLALCKQLAKKMNGSLKVDTSIQTGACFVLSIPIAG